MCLTWVSLLVTKAMRWSSHVGGSSRKKGPVTVLNMTLVLKKTYFLTTESEILRDAFLLAAALPHISG